MPGRGPVRGGAACPREARRREPSFPALHRLKGVIPHCEPHGPPRSIFPTCPAGTAATSTRPAGGRAVMRRTGPWYETSTMTASSTTVPAGAEAPADIRAIFSGRRLDGRAGAPSASASAALSTLAEPTNLATKRVRGRS